MSVDPLTKDYPELTPYHFASNRPIDGIDQDGMEYLSNTKSIYLLRSFQTVSSNYTMNSLLVKNEAAHKIILNHPDERPKGKDGKPLYESSPSDPDPGEVNTMTTPKRYSSTKSQKFSKMETATARREGASDIVGGIIDAIKWGRTTYYNNRYSKEIGLAGTSITALNNANSTLIRM